MLVLAFFALAFAAGLVHAATVSAVVAASPAPAAVAVRVAQAALAAVKYLKARLAIRKTVCPCKCFLAGAVPLVVLVMTDKTLYIT